MASEKLTPEEIAVLPGNQLYKLMSVKGSTPPLPCEWPALGTPKTGGDYDGDYGKYQISLVLDPGDDAVIALQAKVGELEKMARAALDEWLAANPKQKMLAFREYNFAPQTVGKEPNKVETGNLLMRFSQDAARLNKKTDTVRATPTLVKDTAGNKLPKAIKDKISTGSIVRIAFDASPYFVSGIAGLSLKMKLVQLVELVQYGEDVREEDYFDERLSGYVADTDPFGGPEEAAPVEDGEGDF